VPLIAVARGDVAWSVSIPTHEVGEPLILSLQFMRRAYHAGVGIATRAACMLVAKTHPHIADFGLQPLDLGAAFPVPRSLKPFEEMRSWDIRLRVGTH
jgi:hypothetical protein